MTYPPGTVICHANAPIEAALYLIRSGSVTTEMNGILKIIESGGYFGEDQLLADSPIGANVELSSPSTILPTYTAKAGKEPVTLGVLKLAACRKVFDTRFIGQAKACRSDVLDSMLEKGVSMEELKYHTILGAGTFGQVWLVSRKKSNGQRAAYALKIQSKYELVKDGQAQAVVDEKNIMANLKHPFLITLVNTYQDENFVYMLLQLIQGGELYNYIHTTTDDVLHDKDAKFYAACISQGLGFMHRRSFVYRDLKPEVCFCLMMLTFA